MVLAEVALVVVALGCDQTDCVIISKPAMINVKSALPEVGSQRARRDAWRGFGPAVAAKKGFA